MLFRLSTLDDTEAVTEIYDYARKEFRELGIPQWQNGVPGRDSFISDVKAGNSYVMTENGAVAGTVQIVSCEPTYEKVEGGSFSVDSYLAAHRIAVSQSFRGKGIAGKMLSEVCKIARDNCKSSVRIDTHDKNYRMKNLLIKNGFNEIGMIKLEDGSPRKVFEKLL